MNRAQRRAEEAKAKMARNAERIRSVTEEGHNLANQLDRFKAMLFAVAREHGRIRIKASELAKLSEHDRIDFLHQENGDVIVQYSGST